ncbi:MAG TPA: winged helix-turn-helix transcriptional regulator [Candidatus Thermoplasmatota archaeon]|nr:winged helix-turn-helix transcriptional regulator [Candidatus Thermoplasmatota archaeon]
MNRIVLLAVAGAALLGGGAYALTSPAAEPAAVAFPPHRVGDAWTYEVRYSSTAPDGERDEGSLLLSGSVVGRERVADRYGRLVDAAAFVWEVREDGAKPVRVECLAVDGGTSVVQVRVDAEPETEERGGGLAIGPLSLLSWLTTIDSRVQAAYPEGPCPGTERAAGATLREGDVVLLRDLAPVPAGLSVGDNASEPLEATRALDRAALLATFRIPIETRRAHGAQDLVVTLVDGLPMIARVEGSVDLETPDGPASARAEATLVAFTPGEGASLRPFKGAEVPPRHPDGPWVPAGGVSFDDRPFGLPYAFRQAWEDARADGLDAWLADNPDAVLVHAQYAREAVETPAGARPRATWSFRLEDENSWFAAHAWRSLDAAAAPALLAQPLRLAPGVDADEGWGGVTLPEGFAAIELLASEAVARVATPGETPVVGLRFSLLGEDAPERDGRPAAPTLVVKRSLCCADDPERDAEEMTFDLVSGGLVQVASSHAETRRAIVGPPAAASVPPPRASASAVTAQGVTLAGATAAVTGLALLALVAKLVLLPLYTRLRRERLLDNPVRARLHDLVRREPGVHRAVLVEALGVGEGATRHHLRQLVAARILSEIEVDGYARYFVAGDVPPDAARRAAVLRAGSNARVYELLAAEPRLTLREAASRLGLSAPTIHRAKAKLTRAGLLPAPPSAKVEATDAT